MPNKSEMVETCVRFSRDTLECLRTLANLHSIREGRRIVPSMLIRRAVERFLEQPRGSRDGKA
jgi:hypothetical protein